MKNRTVYTMSLYHNSHRLRRYAIIVYDTQLATNIILKKYDLTAILKQLNHLGFAAIKSLDTEEW